MSAENEKSAESKSLGMIQDPGKVYNQLGATDNRIVNLRTCRVQEESLTIHRYQESNAVGRKSLR